MKISIHTEVRGVLASLDALGRTQMPFAVSKAINATLVQGQRAELQHVARTFEQRRPDFPPRIVKIERAGFATKANPVGVIGVQGARADVLAKFEVAGVKVATHGHQYVAVPRTGSIVKPRSGSIVKDNLRPAALRESLTLRTFTKKTKAGRLAIFAVDRVHEAKLHAAARRAAGVSGAVQGRDPSTGRFLGTVGPVLPGRAVTKTERKRARPQALYFLTKTAPIRPALEFVPTLTAAVRSGFVPNLRAALTAALRTARR